MANKSLRIMATLNPTTTSKDILNKATLNKATLSKATLSKDIRTTTRTTTRTTIRATTSRARATSKNTTPISSHIRTPTDSPAPRNNTRTTTNTSSNKHKWSKLNPKHHNKLSKLSMLQRKNRRKLRLFRKCLKKRNYPSKKSRILLHLLLIKLCSKKLHHLHLLRKSKRLMHGLKRLSLFKLSPLKEIITIRRTIKITTKILIRESVMNPIKNRSSIKDLG